MPRKSTKVPRPSFPRRGAGSGNETSIYVSLVPRPRPSMRVWELFLRFKSCDTCLCACAFQQRARDRETAHCVVPRGRGLVAVTREFERDNCVTSEILQSDWTIPNRAGVPTKVPRPSFVRESREGLGPRLHICSLVPRPLPPGNSVLVQQNGGVLECERANQIAEFKFSDITTLVARCVGVSKAPTVQ